MAKQFGVSDAALAGLKDPARHPFPPDQRAALLFADAMTNGTSRVPDPVYDELRRHFSEAQIVEISCVVGLFNYFNRFNNALHVEITLMDPDVLVRRVEEAARAAGAAQDLCDRVIEILQQGRNYVRVRIDQGTAGRTGVTQVVGRELLVPIRTPAGGVVGVIEVENDREAAFDEEERTLVERVAAILASRMA